MEKETLSLRLEFTSHRRTYSFRRREVCWFVATRKVGLDKEEAKRQVGGTSLGQEQEAWNTVSTVGQRLKIKGSRTPEVNRDLKRLG